MNQSPDSSIPQNRTIRLSDQQVVTVQSASGSNQQEASPARRTNRHLGFLTRPTCVAGLVLACVVLFSLYIRVADYGFYEDDYWGIVPWFKTPAAKMWATTISSLKSWPTGRPLNHILPKWFSWIGYHLAGVQGIYFLGFLVHTTNAFLLYLLLRRWLGHWAAVLAGALFVLIPADTTRIFLLHSAHVHTSLTFLLIGLLINRSRFWVASYPIAGLSLLSYETAFLPFIVFPLFFADRQKRILRWLLHLTSCGVVLAIVFGIRLHLGDTRAGSIVSGPVEMLWRMVSSLWIGPETSLKTLVSAILKAPHAQSPFAFLFAALLGLLLALPWLIGVPTVTETPDRRRIANVFVAGLASWIFSYALTLVNYPPTQEAGRFTSTHVAAVFGLTCVLAAAAAYLRSFNAASLKATVTVMMSVLVGCLTLYSFRIQSGFANAWTQERQFWQQVLQLCPDITPTTRIFLVGKIGLQNEFILTNSWADPLVLRDAFAWDQYPLLFYYDGAGKLADIRFDNGQATWKPLYWSNKRETLDLNNVIILQDDGRNLDRIDQLRIEELPFPLQTKKLVEAQPHASPTPLTDFGRFLLKR